MPERLPWLYLSRLSFSAVVLLVFSYLVVIVLTSVPQFQATLLAELQGDRDADSKPSLFLMNIPEETTNEVNTFLQQKGLTLDNPSPFILAQLRTVNGRPPQQAWFKKYPVRLSYRESLLASETVVAGSKEFPPYDAKQGKPWVSIEKDFADRNSINLGDLMVFDIQGVEVEGVVHALRRVEWSSFQPNFFIQFQKGVLDDAPKTFIGTLKLAPGQESKLQFEIARKFPNLSIINIVQAVRRVLDIADKIVIPIQLLAAVTVIVSLFLLMGLIQQTLQARTNELKVFQVIGASAEQILRLLLREFSIILVASFLGGILVASGMAYVVIQNVLNMTPRHDLTSPLIALMVFISLTLGLIYQTARSVVRTELRIKS